MQKSLLALKSLLGFSKDYKITIELVSKVFPQICKLY